MAHGKSVNEQWSAEPIKLAADNPCGAIQPEWPYKTCNLLKGHAGEHCNVYQAGIYIARLWWE